MKNNIPLPYLLQSVVLLLVGCAILLIYTIYTKDFDKIPWCIATFIIGGALPMILVNIGNKDVILFKKTDEPKTYLFLWKIHYQNDQIISLRPTKWLARISVIYYFVVLYFFPETVFLFLNVSVQFIFIFSAGMYSIGRTDIAQKI